MTRHRLPRRTLFGRIAAALAALLIASLAPGAALAQETSTPTPSATPTKTATRTPTATVTLTATRTATPTITPTFTPDPLSSLECPHAPPILEVDGKLVEWMGRPSLHVNRDTAATSDNLPPPGRADLSSEVWCAWQGNDLIFAAIITDDTMVRDSAQVWLDDSIELAIDGLNNGWVYGRADDHQFTVDTAASVFDLGTYPVPAATAVALPQAVGWRVEVRFPAAALKMGNLFAGRAVPFNTGLNDDDNGGGRDDWLAWRGSSTNSRSEDFGALVLSGDVTPFPTPTPTSTVLAQRLYLPVLLR